MSEVQPPVSNEEATTEAPRKMSLAEAARQKLAQKKAEAHGFGQQKPQAGGNQTMKSQLVKKPNNQRRRMGV